MKRISMIVNRLPFSGKWAIKEAVIAVVSSTSSKKLRSNLIYFYALMVFFILAHALQGLLGIRLVTHAQNPIIKAYGLLYSAANFSVTLVQLYTTGRITFFTIRRWRPAAHVHEYKAPLKEEIISIIVTWTGQIIFLVMQSVCI